MDNLALAKAQEWLERFEYRRPRGIIEGFSRRGKLLYTRENLFVNAGKAPLANLLGGVTAGESVLAAGFGSGSAAPAVTDTDLGLAPKYYKAVVAPVITGSSAQFTLTLAATDYAANPLTVTEIGLFANVSTVALPVALGTANPAWAASTAKVVGNLIVDANGNIQRCTTAGTTGAAAPAWATAINATTTDGTVTWTMIAAHNIPGPMISHALVPSFAFTGSGTSNWTWTLTF